MLQLLHIENIAVIERADIELDKGLTVLSGETGAGKSIVIDSIGALLGKRVSRDLVRSGAQKGFVSAVFTDLPRALRELLDELALSGDEPEHAVRSAADFRGRQEHLPRQHEAGQCSCPAAAGAVSDRHSRPE